MSAAGDKEGQDAWVFDSLVGFLRGPVWIVPILTFIEQKSIVFEPNSEELEDEYKKIHEEYKNLVDFMLGSYMEDMGISSQQFEAACGVASARIKSEFHHTLFEQVWAADDYEIFKRMMIQKNIELQLQALELLQHRYGVLPDSLRPFQIGSATMTAEGGKSQQVESEAKVMEAVAQTSMTQKHHSKGRRHSQPHQGSEKLVMKAVSRKSVAEHEESVKSMDEENQKLEEAIANTSSVDVERLEAEKNNQQMLLAEHLSKVSISDPSRVLGQSAPTAVTPAAGGDMDEAEMERRKDFLKAQRDKLLAMKREEREKQLAEAEQQQMTLRPKSARAARSAFGGPGGRGAAATGSLDPETLRVRRALAEKLKQEVIGKH